MPAAREILFDCAAVQVQGHGDVAVRAGRRAGPPHQSSAPPAGSRSVPAVRGRHAGSDTVIVVTGVQCPHCTAAMGAEEDNQNSILKGILQNGSSFNYPGG